MRYLPHTDEIRQDMLKAIGVPSVDALFKDIPSTLLNPEFPSLPDHQSELEVDRFFKRHAANTIQAGDVPFFLGAGCYRHHIPAAVDHLIQRGEFLTSYTPYQPEISQGTLQYLFEFQTQVCLLTGMEVANASMYDGATATAEAVMMAQRITKRRQAVLSGNIHPHYLEVIKTYGHYCEFDVRQNTPQPAGHSEQGEITADTACVVVQYPDFFGHVHDFSDLAESCHKAGALLIICFNEVVALGLLKSPGDMGADIVCGEGQALGVGLNFGGPTVGLFATRQSYLRQMPGRICGETVDADGKRGYTLTLSTREQHIRREKATSNICTNSGLCALAFTIHLTLLGEIGLQRLARLNHAKAIQLKEKLDTLKDVTVLNTSFFNEFIIQVPFSSKKFIDDAANQGLLAGLAVSRLLGDDYDHLLLLCCTETTTDADINKLVDFISTY
ncbi:MAG: aminomethyl-transferring glycine dehydrogenase subunit GcvPA [Candidatus Paracaedibacteraceae bacterium]|nr:aminomethyl-transferring glycine dehydrogenase subunit GcvPA [Candidatus Paracaedibacteraceae bacterium]